MAMQKRYSRRNFRAATTVAESGREGAHSSRTTLATRNTLRAGSLEGALPAGIRVPQNSRAGDITTGVATLAAGSVWCFSSLRYCCRHHFFVVVAAAALTWFGVVGEVARHIVGAAATSNQEGERLAATGSESSNEELLLGDLLPALRYRALLSPWIWLICLCSFFLLHAFCRQVVLLLRQQRGQRISKVALLLQSKVFPLHGVNRLMSTLHALVALNWGVLVLMERYTTPNSLVSNAADSASTAGGTRISRAAADSSKVSPVPICLWGFGEPVTPQERALLLFTLSYFIYDTWYEGFYGNVCDCVHHGAAILGLLNVLGSDVGARDLIAALIVGELSTPLLHLRYYCIQFAKNLAAVTASRDISADSTMSSAPSDPRTVQQQQQHSRQQREQQQNEVGEGHRHTRIDDSNKESGDVSAGISPASTASTVVLNGSPSTTSRSTPGSRTAAGGTSTATNEIEGVRSQTTAMKNAATHHRNHTQSTQRVDPGAIATGAGVAAERALVEGAGHLPNRAPQAGVEAETSAGANKTAAPAVGSPSCATTIASSIATGCNSASRGPPGSLAHSAHATAARSTEYYSRPRVRAETFISSGPNVHIPAPDPAATTGAAAILAAALGTAVAAAALGAAATAAAATTAAIAAASCSFVVFSLVLRLSQRGGDPNSMFATSFHIPAGYVYPPSPRSESPSSYRTGEAAPGERAAPAAAPTQDQEIDAVEAFLKRCRDRIHAWLDGVEKSFFLVFIVGRALLAPCVVYACVTCPSTPILVRTSGMIILVVSCYWLFLLFRHVRNRKHRKRDTGGKETSSCAERATT